MLLCLVVFVESINLLAIRKHFALIFFVLYFAYTYMRRGSGVKGATSCQLLSSLHPFKRKFSMRVRNLYLKLRYTIYSTNRLLVYLQGGTISNAISLTFCLCLCQCAENTRISQQSEMLFRVECTQLGRIVLPFLLVVSLTWRLWWNGKTRKTDETDVA